MDWEDFIVRTRVVEGLVGSSELAAEDEVDDSMTTGNAVVRGLEERFYFLDVSGSCIRRGVGTPQMSGSNNRI